MPWKECSVMDERLRFVAKLLDGEAMSHDADAHRGRGTRWDDRREAQVCHEPCGPRS